MSNNITKKTPPVRYPIPNYSLFEDYVLLTTGANVIEGKYNVIRIPKELFLKIAKCITTS